MTNITLSVNNTTFTFQNGDVTSCKGAPISDLETSMITGTGPMSVYNYEYNGSGKTLTISGVLTEAESTRTSTGTTTSILQQKQWLESLINGQQKSITLINSYESESVDTTSGATIPYQARFHNTECLVNSITFEEHSGNPDQLMFNMTLSVGEGIIIIVSYLLLETGELVLLETEDYIII